VLCPAAVRLDLLAMTQLCLAWFRLRFVIEGRRAACRQRFDRKAIEELSLAVAARQEGGWAALGPNLASPGTSRACPKHLG
jgi:hypothetical protein